MSKRPPTEHDRLHQAIIPGAGKADIHIHTNHSDGSSSAQEVLEHVQHHTDLDVIAITDHDTLTGALEAKRLHEQGNYRFELILGQEITSQVGHIIGLFLTEPVPKELSVSETIRRIHVQRGLAIAAHPMLVMRYINPDMLTANGVGADCLMTEPFDAIEIVNGTPLLGKENARAKLLNRTMLFRAETGGSDGHILEAIGKAYTLFPGKTVDDFRRSVEQKTCEAVSTRYAIREKLKYLKFAIKMKARETGVRLFRGGKKITKIPGRVVKPKGRS